MIKPIAIIFLIFILHLNITSKAISTRINANDIITEHLQKNNVNSPKKTFSLKKLAEKFPQLNELNKDQIQESDETEVAEKKPKKRIIKPDPPQEPIIINHFYHNKIKYGSRSDCFPFEKLRSHQKEIAEQILDSAVKSEALYTIVGGIKPITILSNWYYDKLLSTLNREEIEEVFNSLRSGQEGDVLFILNHSSHKNCCKDKDCIHNPRYQIYVVNFKTLKNKIDAFPQIFNAQGINKNTSLDVMIRKVIIAGENETFVKYLLGYPQSSINLQQEFINNKDNLLKLQTVNIKTPSYHLNVQYKQPQVSVFSWPIATENSIGSYEQKLKDKTDKIAHYYLNFVHAQAHKLGIVIALRNWFDTGNHLCSSLEAYQKVKQNRPLEIIKEIEQQPELSKTEIKPVKQEELPENL